MISYHQSINNSLLSYHKKISVRLNEKWLSYGQKSMPKYGIIDIFRAFLAYDLAKYQYFLMRPSLFDKFHQIPYSVQFFAKILSEIPPKIFGGLSQKSGSSTICGISFCNPSKNNYGKIFIVAWVIDQDVTRTYEKSWIEKMEFLCFFESFLGIKSTFYMIWNWKLQGIWNLIELIE